MPLLMIDTASLSGFALRTAGALAVSAGLAFACPQHSEPCARPAPPPPPAAAPAAPAAFPVLRPVALSGPRDAVAASAVWTPAPRTGASMVEWLSGPIHVAGARSVRQHRVVERDRVVVVLEIETDDGDEAELRWIGDAFSGEVNGRAISGEHILHNEDGVFVVTDAGGAKAFELARAPRPAARVIRGRLHADGVGDEVGDEVVFVTTHEFVAGGNDQDARAERRARAERQARAEQEARADRDVRERRLREIEARVRAPHSPGEPPRIGITFTEPGRTLARQLNIDTDGAVVISGLMEGMPAQRAGLKANDIIIRIGDEKDGGERAIRKVLSGKRPGDTVSLVVLREGEKKEFTLKLDKPVVTGLRLRPDAPDAPAPPLLPGVPLDRDARGPGAWFADAEGEWRVMIEEDGEIERIIVESLAEAEKAIEEAMGDGRAQRELELALRAVEKARAESAESIARLRRLGVPSANALIGRLNNNDDESTFVFRSPFSDATDELAEDLDERFEELEESIEDRFDELEDQIDDLHDQLDSLADRLEALLDRLEAR